MISLSDRLPSRLDDSSRGQTTIDYAVGASIFLFVVGGVLLFIPTIFEPLSTSTTTNAIIADHTATHLSTEVLNDGQTTATLDVVCTAAFFGQDVALDDGCGFDADSSTRVLLGIPESTEVRVTISSPQPRGEPSAITQEVEGDEYEFTRSTGTADRNIAIATRIVSIDGDQYRLLVEVW